MRGEIAERVDRTFYTYGRLVEGKWWWDARVSFETHDFDVAKARAEEASIAVGLNYTVVRVTKREEVEVVYERGINPYPS